MKEIHFYANKTSNLFLFIISVLFCFAFIYFYEDLQNKSLLKIIIAYLGFILFTFYSVYSFILLIRRKPLLTITNKHIIIYNLLIGSVSISFEDVSQFYISKTIHRGIKTNEDINIVLKYYKKEEVHFLKHNNIQVDILNIKATVLLKILNDRLNNA